MESEPPVESPLIHPYPYSYYVLEGPGATGKSKITEILPDILARLFGCRPNTLPCCTFSEPFKPVNWPTDIPTPYLTTKEQLLSGAPYSYILYLTAIRRMMWGSATYDMKPLDPEFHHTLLHPGGIFVGDRSPLSMIYQGLYPGSSIPDVNMYYPLLYKDGLIPFPDCLFVLMPDPEAQKDRLLARIKAEGRLDDFGDAIDIQGKIIAGYKAILRIIGKWTGVYQLQSQEVKYKQAIGLSTAIALLIFINLIEKGRYNQDYLIEMRTPAYKLINPYNSSMKIYLFRGIVGRGVNEARRHFVLPPDDRDLWERGGVIVKDFGDLALVIYGFDMYLLIIEDPTNATMQEAQIAALEGRYTILEPDIRGQKPNTRSWSGIIW